MLLKLKQHKPWFNKRCSKLLDQKKQAKLQWLKHLSQINGNNLNVKYEASRHFWKKKRVYLKDKFNELATHRKNKNIEDLYRGLEEFKNVTNLELTW
jgi:hypothetical protein